MKKLSELISVLRSFFIALGRVFKKPNTVKYRTDNEERIPMYERMRGELILNLPQCRGCALCVEACPNDKALVMVPFDNKNPKNPKKIVPEYNLADCTFCMLCVEACPFGVLQAGRVYDSAYTSLEDMIRTPEQMYEEWQKQKGELKKKETKE